ncbi:MAG: hypothetical protein K0M69_05180, partial [Youngiibacter sp.]|nr:hypothetical protein [Youngiibacter sp.]
MKNRLNKSAVALAIIFVSIFTWISPATSVSAYYNASSTSAKWRYTNDYKGLAGKELYPDGWIRHKDGTLPGAGIVTNIGLASQPSKAPKYFTVTSGVDSGRMYKIVYAKTGRRYYLKVRQLVGWRNSVTGSNFDFVLKSGESATVTSSVAN